MTAWANNLNGITSGTTVTTGNSGGVSGTAFNTATVPSGGSLTAQSTAAEEGACGLQIVYPSTSSFGPVGWNATATVGTRFTASFWFRFGSLPSLTDTIFATSTNASLKVNASGQVLALSSTGSTLATATAVAAGTWLFIQYAITTNASTSGGRIECNVKKADATSLLAYDSGATVNAGTTAVSTISFGRTGFTSSANTYSYDLLAADNTLSSGFPGTPPTPTGGNIKIWNGTAWVVKPVKIWNGTAWVTKPVKRWNGTAWVRTSY